MTVDLQGQVDWTPYVRERASNAAIDLHDYWASKRSTPENLPSRSDIRPEEIKALLPFIWLMDVDPPAGSFRYRLIGTAVVDGVGEDYTGRTLDQCFPNEGAYEHATRALRQVIADGRPRWRRGPPMFRHKSEALQLENLILPLATDRRTPDRLLGLTLFFDSESRLFRPGVIRAT